VFACLLLLNETFIQPHSSHKPAIKKIFDGRNIDSETTSETSDFDPRLATLEQRAQSTMPAARMKKCPMSCTCHKLTFS
jgi:hypothetical protein